VIERVGAPIDPLDILPKLRTLAGRIAFQVRSLRPDVWEKGENRV